MLYFDFFLPHLGVKNAHPSSCVLGGLRSYVSCVYSSSVRWQQSVEQMISAGIDTFVEIGSGRTLTGFIKKIDKNVRTFNIQTVEDLEKTAAEI